jgi:transposase
MKDKYVGLDVHSATISGGYLDEKGSVMMQTVFQTKAESVRDFLGGIRGRVHVTFEQGTQAAWLYDIVRPLVYETIVCDPRKNRLLLSGSKSDKIDWQKLAELLRNGSVNRVYQQPTLRPLRELAFSYDSLVHDSVRVMTRIKSLYRSRGIYCRRANPYRPDKREEWLAQVKLPELKIRLVRCYEQLDLLMKLRPEAKASLLNEIRKYPERKYLRCPGIKSLRIAMILSTAATPHRFRTKRQYWAYAGLAVETKSSDDYELFQGRIRRKRKPPLTRGLNRNFSRRLKRVYKGAAQNAKNHRLFKPYYTALLDQRRLRSSLANLTLARKIAAINLLTWKKEERFNSRKVNLDPLNSGGLIEEK